MNTQTNPTESLYSSLQDDSSPLRSSNEDINNLINGARFIYDYDAAETFPETDLISSESINVVYNDLRNSFDLTEPNDPTHNSRNDDEQLAINKSTNASLPVSRASTDKSTKTSIALSNSVAVTNSKQGKLQLVYPLEETYRPRYKSDYFPQSGVVRRPRYIADNATNHFITLQLPTEYQNDFQNLYIRVALITKSIEGHGHYYSPYKFQKDHNDINVPDENPLFIKVETSQEDSYIMRLQLVLIKSKLDHLNHVQPLQLFSDRPTSTRHLAHEEKLAPKDLINQYQLDKSHIAFTLCTKLSNGTFQLHPDTTVTSSVITEALISRKPNEPTASSNVDSTQNVHCPHCAHRFDPDTPSGSESTSITTTPKASRSRTSTEKRSNKRKKE